MKTNKLLLTIILLLFSLTINAAVISYSDSFNIRNSFTAGITSDDSYSSISYGVLEQELIRLAAFDSNLGSLTSVDISFTSSWSHWGELFTMDNSTSGTPDSGYYNDVLTNGTSYSSYSIGLYEPSFTSTNISDDIALSCFDSDTFMDSNLRCLDVNSSSNNIFNDTLDLSSIALDSFNATPINNDIILGLGNYQGISMTCDDDDVGDMCEIISQGEWRGTVSVDYIYNESISVPEPSILPMLCLGLLGSLFAVQRKKTFKHPLY